MIYDIENMRKLQEHNLRVGELSHKLAQLMYLSEEECKNIKNAAQNHDIGKLLIPSEILLKPAALTDEEFKIMEKHSTYSYEILKKKGFSEKICKIVKHHHENFDGTGYPDGLKGFDIPRGSMIIKVCDIFDALVRQ